jgi:DNA-binding transcriptional LysR family regulator
MDGTIDIEGLVLFVTVAESASFSAAARALAMAKSSVSRGVTRFEERTGAQLLHRTTRKVSPTTSGAALLERVAPLVRALRLALTSLPEKEEEPAGDLRLTAPNDIGVTLLSEVVTHFSARYPRVHVDVELTSRPVNLVGEGFDLALRASGPRLADSSLVMRKIVSFELQFFSTPGYLARRGTPRTVAEATKHDLVIFRPMPFPAFRPKARLSGRVIRGDDFLFVRETIKAGGGIGLMPAFFAKSDQAAGTLVRVLPRFPVSDGQFALLYPRARHIPRKVSAFRDFLVDYVAGHRLFRRDA